VTVKYQEIDGKNISPPGRPRMIANPTKPRSLHHKDVANYTTKGNSSSLKDEAVDAFFRFMTGAFPCE